MGLDTDPLNSYISSKQNIMEKHNLIKNNHTILYFEML